MPAALELSGHRFNRLLVIKRVKVEGARNVMWECQCDCGNITIAAAANIGKTTQSCGCLAKETATELLRGNTLNRTHNRSHSGEYYSWCAMKSRCYIPTNHKYPIYGSRGISVCDRWRDSFENFLADMGPKPSPKHSIDRKDNDGNYEPGNCHWATKKQQSRNTRKNHMIEIDGQRMCLIEWCEKLSVHKNKPWEMIRKRNGRTPFYSTIEEAVTALYHRLT